MYPVYSLSLKRWLPLVIIFSTIILLSSIAWLEKESFLTNRYLLSQSIVTRDMISLRHEIETEYLEGNPEHSVLALAVKAKDKRFTSLALVDENKIVLHSVYGILGHNNQAFLLDNFNESRFNKVLISNRMDIQIDATKDNISVYLPVQLSSTKNGVTHNVQSVIFAIYELNSIRQIIWEKTLDAALPMTLILLIIFCILFLFLQYVISRPIRYLVAATRSIAQGDFKVQSLIQGTGELAQLSQSFNTMSEELSQREQRLLQTLAELKQSEERWHFAIEGNKAGVWDWDITENKVLYSNRWKELLGFTENEFSDDTDEWKQRIHSEDKKRCFSQLNRYLSGKSTSYESEHRMLCKDGSYLWVLDRGMIVSRLKDSQPSRMIGTYTDISHLKEIEESNKSHLEFLSQMSQINHVISKSTTIESLMSQVLEMVLELLDVDRAWLLYPCNPSAKNWYVPMEKTKPDYPGVLSLNLEMPVIPEVAQAFARALKEKDVITIDEYKDGAPKETAKQFGNKSEMHMAIHAKTGDAWLFGVHQCKKIRHWDQESIQLFKEIGLRLADALNAKLYLRDLYQSEQRYRSIFQSTKVAIIVVDDLGLITEWNETASNIFGYSIDETTGKEFFFLVHGSHRENYRNEFAKMQKNSVPQISKGSSTLNGLHKNGDLVQLEQNLSTWTIDGKIFFCALLHDISERLEQQEIITHQAHYDALTGLPNRFLALDRLKLLLSDAQRDNSLIAVLFLDLDDFKKVNDCFGHDVGDQVLIEAANRINSVLRSGDTVGRLGGDEFVVLLQGIVNEKDTHYITNNILKQFRQPFKLGHHRLALTMSGGLAFYPNDGKTVTDLLKKSDTAMYHAKALGRNQFSYFTKAMNEEAERRVSLEEEMEGALERDEFEVLYQPKISIKTGEIIGTEALLRWNNRHLGSVSPNEFINVAEQTGFIIELGQFVLKEALRETNLLQQITEQSLSIAINLSPRQFRDPTLLNSIKDAIKNEGILSQYIEFEITEGLLLSNNPDVLSVLNGLKQLGVSLALDDFGTGYSSLSYLRQYPFDVLKIDKSFINDIVSDASSHELVTAIIAMAHSLSLNIVAEGIETQEQLEIINRLGCQQAQGYLYSKPLSAKLVAELLNAKTHYQFN